MSDFQNLLMETVRDFLQTVIVVDDEAVLPVISEIPEVIDTPIGILSDDDVTTPLSLQTDIVGIDQQNHTLDAKSVVDGYAKLGLVCAVLRPTAGDPDDGIGSVIKVASRADIVVLDWRMLVESGKEEGELALQMIGEIVRHDAAAAGRTRLIIIYTASPGIAFIEESIRGKLIEIGFSEEEVVNQSSYIKAGSNRIAVYQKPRTATIDSTRLVGFDELPEKTVFEFASANKGLLANAFLKSIALLRKNTHHILEKMESRTDLPYIAHRMLLPDPYDAQDFGLDLIVSEIKSTLLNNAAGESLSLASIQKWWGDKYSEADEFELPFPGGSLKLSNEQLLPALEIGFNNKNYEFGGASKTLQRGYRKDIHNHLLSALCKSPDEADVLNTSFSQLTTFSRKFIPLVTTEGYRKPTLTLGVLVATREAEGFDYWLCLQARCDSVRIPISKPRQFSFLKLRTVRQSESFDLTVDSLLDSHQAVKLKVSFKPYEMRHEVFTSDAQSEQIVAHRDDESRKWIFRGAASQYIWAADLKFEYAQRIANRYAAHVARVGVDEYEWLRLTARSGSDDA